MTLHFEHRAALRYHVAPIPFLLVLQKTHTVEKKIHFQKQGVNTGGRVYIKMESSGGWGRGVTRRRLLFSLSERGQGKCHGLAKGLCGCSVPVGAACDLGSSVTEESGGLLSVGVSERRELNPLMSSARGHHQAEAVPTASCLQRAGSSIL